MDVFTQPAGETWSKALSTSWVREVKHLVMVLVMACFGSSQGFLGEHSYCTYIDIIYIYICVHKHIYIYVCIIYWFFHLLIQWYLCNVGSRLVCNYSDLVDWQWVSTIVSSFCFPGVICFFQFIYFCFPIVFLFLRKVMFHVISLKILTNNVIWFSFHIVLVFLFFDLFVDWDSLIPNSMFVVRVLYWVQFFLLRWDCS